MAAVLLLLAATPADEPERDLAIFTAPIAIAGAAAAPFVTSGALSSFAQPVVFIPLGAAFTAADIEWAVDAAFVFQEPAFFVGYAGFWFSAGPMIHPGTRALRGLFFSPKLTVGGFRLRAFNPGVASDKQTMFSFALGADFGYQLTWGRLYVAILIGASLGLGWSDADGFAGPFVSINSADVSGTPSAVIGLNLQALRIGYTF